MQKNELLKIVAYNSTKNNPFVLDFNFENDDIVDEVLTIFDKNKTYSATSALKEIAKYKLKRIKEISNGKNYKFSTKYWKSMGWDWDMIVKNIKTHTKGEIFFYKEDALKYILNKKPFDFNLDNIDFIKSFLDKYMVSDDLVYTERGLKSLFDQYIADFYKEHYDTDVKFKDVRIEYFIARGFTEEKAKEIISYRQRLKAHSININGSVKFSDDELIEIMNEICENERNQTKESVKYWKSVGYNDGDAIEKSLSSRNTNDVSLTYTDINKFIIKNKHYGFKRIDMVSVPFEEMDIIYTILHKTFNNIIFEPFTILIDNNECRTLYTFDYYLKIGNAIILIDVCDINENKNLDFVTAIQNDSKALGAIRIDKNIFHKSVFELTEYIESMKKSVNHIINMETTVKIIK